MQDTEPETPSLSPVEVVTAASTSSPPPLSEEPVPTAIDSATPAPEKPVPATEDSASSANATAKPPDLVCGSATSPDEDQVEGKVDPEEITRMAPAIGSRIEVLWKLVTGEKAHELHWWGAVVQAVELSESGPPTHVLVYDEYAGHGTEIARVHFGTQGSLEDRGEREWRTEGTGKGKKRHLITCKIVIRSCCSCFLSLTCCK